MSSLTTRFVFVMSWAIIETSSILQTGADTQRVPENDSGDGIDLTTQDDCQGPNPETTLRGIDSYAQTF
jgi:hypothetical protein